MNPMDLIPTPDAIPVHWGWLKFFHLLTLGLHFLLMAIMLGSALIAFVGMVIGNAGEDRSGFHRDVADKLPFAIAFAVNAGVAPLLFVQALFGHLVYVSSILLAVYWLGVVGLLIVGYYCAYGYKYKFSEWKNGRHVLISAAAATLMFVAFIFVNNFTLMERPDVWTVYFENADGTFLNWRNPVLLPRYLHVVGASITVAGLFLAVIWSRKKRRGVPAAEENRERGMRWFVGGAAIQFGTGIWLLLVLRPDGHGLFLTPAAPLVILVTAGAGAAVLGIVAGLRRMTGWAAVGTLVTVGLMVVIRDAVRTAYLQPYVNVANLPVRPDYGPMIVFLIALAAGIVVIGYMLRLVYRSEPTLNR